MILGGDGPDPDGLRPAPGAEDAEPASALAMVFERPLDVASMPVLGRT